MIAQHLEDQPGRVWPAWMAGGDTQILLAAPPLTGALGYWSRIGRRPRNPTEWMATLLGVAPVGVVSPRSACRLDRTSSGWCRYRRGPGLYRFVLLKPALCIGHIPFLRRGHPCRLLQAVGKELRVTYFGTFLNVAVSAAIAAAALVLFAESGSKRSTIWGVHVVRQSAWIWRSNRRCLYGDAHWHRQASNNRGSRRGVRH
jgi:hypothetical protein